MQIPGLGRGVLQQTALIWGPPISEVLAWRPDLGTGPGSSLKTHLFKSSKLLSVTGTQPGWHAQPSPPSTALGPRGGALTLPPSATELLQAQMLRQLMQGLEASFLSGLQGRAMTPHCNFP